MSSNFLVRYTALFWSFVVFMPVGMNYLAFFALAVCMSIQGDRMARWQRVRRHLLFWPLAIYLGWTAVVLALQSALYAETASNLWHGLRIVLTLTLALALTVEEASWALRSFAVAVVFSLLVIFAHKALGLPEFPVWRNLLHYAGNKSISNALLFCVVAGSMLVIALSTTGRVRLASMGVALALLAVLVFVLPNRTALLAVLGALLAAAAHQWRQHKLKLLGFVVAVLLAGVALLATVPAVQAPLAQGVGEIRRAAAGEASMGSWNIRSQMIRYTTEMIAERPWMGWGIGGWNDQWRKRVPPLLADLNMPHNDLLWMGAQAGVPGALCWLAIMLAACYVGWRRQDLTGRLAFVAALTLTFSALVNSATRDAVIGLSLLWIVGLYLRLASDAGFTFSLPERKQSR